MSSLSRFSLHFKVSLQQYLVHHLERDREHEFADVTVSSQSHSFQ